MVLILKLNPFKNGFIRFKSFILRLSLSLRRLLPKVWEL